MKLAPIRRILGRIEHADLVGRNATVDRLVSHAGSETSRSLCLLAAPGMGLTELLRQTYDRLFAEQGDVIPVYFELRAGDRDSGSLAARFLYEFLVQAVAFRRRDPNVIFASPDLLEIAELALPRDADWVDSARRQTTRDEERSYVRSCLSAPLRAAGHGVRCLVMIDGLQFAGSHSPFFEEVVEIARRSDSPFVLAGLRRFLFGKTELPLLELPDLSFADAGRVTEKIAARGGSTISEQTRDLVAVQLCRSPKLIATLLSAAAHETSLGAFEPVQRVYTDEIFGGMIGRDFDRVLGRAFPDKELESRVIRLIGAGLDTGGGDIKGSDWAKHARSDDRALAQGLEILHNHELLNLNSGFVSADPSNIVFRDYVLGRVAIESNGVPRARAVGEALASNIKRAPYLMAEHYRRNASIGLRELMLAFDGRRISPALLDYARFKAEFKGAKVEKILKAVKASEENVSLPYIVYSASTAHFYPPIRDLCETGRSAVAIGFTDTGKKKETVWIAAQIDSKLEATRQLAEFWCDRLEMAAENSGFTDYKLWLIAPEGFDNEGLAALAERQALGSSRHQVELLAGILNSPFSTLADDRAADEYEITVPMGDEAELLAARTIEEIGKRYNFPSKAVNQVKTAVVEACINASEHSLSPDRRIHQRFSVTGETLTVTITNRGIRLTDKDLSQADPDGPRRGWGLKLMQSLMDDVAIEQTDDGTRITMTKVIKS